MTEIYVMIHAHVARKPQARQIATADTDRHDEAQGLEKAWPMLGFDWPQTLNVPIFLLCH